MAIWGSLEITNNWVCMWHFQTIDCNHSDKSISVEWKLKRRRTVSWHTPNSSKGRPPMDLSRRQDIPFWATDTIIFEQWYSLILMQGTLPRQFEFPFFRNCTGVPLACYPPSRSQIHSQYWPVGVFTWQDSCRWSVHCWCALWFQTEFIQIFDLLECSLDKMHLSDLLPLLMCSLISAILRQGFNHSS